jgi:hypothetical protein
VGISSTRETECTTKHCHCATSVAGNDAGLQTRARSYIHPTFLCPAFSTPPSAFNLTYNCLRTYHGPLSPLSPQSRPTRCTASVSGLLPSPTPDIRVRGNPPSLPSIRGIELGICASLRKTLLVAWRTMAQLLRTETDFSPKTGRYSWIIDRVL